VEKGPKSGSRQKSSRRQVADDSYEDFEVPMERSYRAENENMKLAHLTDYNQRDERAYEGDEKGHGGNLQVGQGSHAGENKQLGSNLGHESGLNKVGENSRNQLDPFEEDMHRLDIIENLEIRKAEVKGIKLEKPQVNEVPAFDQFYKEKQNEKNKPILEANEENEDSLRISNNRDSQSKQALPAHISKPESLLPHSNHFQDDLPKMPDMVKKGSERSAKNQIVEEQKIELKARKESEKVNYVFNRFQSEEDEYLESLQEFRGPPMSLLKPTDENLKDPIKSFGQVEDPNLFKVSAIQNRPGHVEDGMHNMILKEKEMLKPGSLVQGQKLDEANVKLLELEKEKERLGLQTQQAGGLGLTGVGILSNQAKQGAGEAQPIQVNQKAVHFGNLQRTTR
jgi:hypothetical protein